MDGVKLLPIDSELSMSANILSLEQVLVLRENIHLNQNLLAHCTIHLTHPDVKRVAVDIIGIMEEV